MPRRYRHAGDLPAWVLLPGRGQRAGCAASPMSNRIGLSERRAGVGIGVRCRLVFLDTRLHGFACVCVGRCMYVCMCFFMKSLWSACDDAVISHIKLHLHVCPACASNCILKFVFRRSFVYFFSYVVIFKLCGMLQQLALHVCPVAFAMSPE